MKFSQSPRFVGIGSSFAGWSEVKQILGGHPSVHNNIPTLDFFYGEHWKNHDMSWYVKSLPTPTPIVPIVGEGSVSYFGKPGLPKRLVQTIPDTTLIATVRHPLKRAVAEYVHMKRHPEVARYRTCGEYLNATPAAVERGMYGKVLREYYELYSPVQLLVLTYDSLLENPLKVAQRLYRHFEINVDYVPPILAKYAPEEEMPKKPRLSTRMKAQIKKQYRKLFQITAPVWDPEEYELRRYFTPDEIRYWQHVYMADAVLLSDLIYENMIVTWWEGE